MFGFKMFQTQLVKSVCFIKTMNIHYKTNIKFIGLPQNLKKFIKYKNKCQKYFFSNIFIIFNYNSLRCYLYFYSEYH